jgi:hypothetical protein
MKMIYHCIRPKEEKYRQSTAHICAVPLRAIIAFVTLATIGTHNLTFQCDILEHAVSLSHGQY